MGLTVGQMCLNIMLPILLVNVIYWGTGDTTGLPENTLEVLNTRSAYEWTVRWLADTVPITQCTQLSIQQISEYACFNDYYYDAEAVPPPASEEEEGSGEDRRRRRHLGRRRQGSIFLTHREASNFLHRSKRPRIRTRRSTTISHECCVEQCIWEEVGEYCYHPREWHLP